ncbi:MAG: hypothetical protein IKV96_03335, partial [Firmicutes bacterium]|nr:hypothetical protein [Bacillota bacterium]
MSKFDMKNSKSFSIGLNLNETIEDYEIFLDEYGGMISSIYFSPLLGRKFYSRTELEDECDKEDSLYKLKKLLDKFRSKGIRSEMAVNTFGLTEDDIDLICRFTTENEIVVDEVVCLAQYGKQLRDLYHRAEIKYSFNNPKIDRDALAYFDTVVAGKELLRDKAARHELVEAGKEIVLLLNNGCTFACHYPCGDSEFCGKILDKSLKEHNLDYLYAQQSFFPEELKRLLETDEYAYKYRFKISNRPLGLEFTRQEL